MICLINPFAIYTQPTYTYNTRSIDTSNASAYTFTGLNIGAADDSRFVIIAITAARLTTLSISGVTIGGVAATKLAEITGSGAGQFAVASIFGLSVPSGTTADVVVTPSGSALDCAVASYSLYNLSTTTPYATATSTANPLSLNANTLKDSIVIGIGQQGINTATTFSWSGLTERYDEVVETSIIRWGGADDQMTSDETPRAISASFSSAPTGPIAGALVVMK